MDWKKVGKGIYSIGRNNVIIDERKFTIDVFVICKLITMIIVRLNDNIIVRGVLNEAKLLF